MEPTRTWLADTEPNPTRSLYTRGNAGEVFPNVITVLTGTLIGDAIRRGQNEFALEMGALRPHEISGPALWSGVFGGYLYLNAATMRVFGIRMPGVGWQDMDEQLTGGGHELPPHHMAKGDRNLVATLAIMRMSAGILRRPDLTFLDEARAGATRWLATMPELAAATDQELLDWLATFPPRQAESMKLLARTATIVAAPMGILARLLNPDKVPAGLVNRLVGGTGDVDSAQPANRMWELGRRVADDLEVSQAFDAGLDDVIERTQGSWLPDAMADFLDHHGHRGNDEYELASLPWAMDPQPVYAAIDRLRHAPADRDPGAAALRLRADAEEALDQACDLVARPARRLLKRAVTVARVGSIARERAKDILVLENLGARRVLYELASRAAARGGPSDLRRSFCITIDELPDYLARPEDFAEVTEERSALERYLNERLPPHWFESRQPDPSTWPLRANAAAVAPVAGETRTGIGVSGGSATGPARVIVDPADPRGLEPGEILVCAITDPSWTPLFLAAGAVVCDTGALQSHASIVARELGIPAVMSVDAITSVADGTMLHVDGDQGTVSIL